MVRKAKGLYDGHFYLIALGERPILGVFSLTGRPSSLHSHLFDFYHE